MRDYRFYPIGADGHVIGPPGEHEFPDDQSAIAEANLAAVSNDIEVWQRERMVAYIVADETRQTPAREEA